MVKYVLSVITLYKGTYNVEERISCIELEIGPQHSAHEHDKDSSCQSSEIPYKMYIKISSVLENDQGVQSWKFGKIEMISDLLDIYKKRRSVTGLSTL